MKKVYFLAIAALLPVQAIAIDNDSVYTWGAWAEGMQPAAGPVARVTPPPAERPDVNFRPNENSAFLREATVALRAEPELRPAPPVVATAPQVPNVVIAPSDTPTTPVDQF